MKICEKCCSPGLCIIHGLCALLKQAPPEVPDIRPELVKFALEMELKLRKNDHKTSWRKLPIEALFRQFLLEVEEFKVADEFLSVAESRKESVDLANFALILWDRLGMLDQDKTRQEQEQEQEQEKK